MHQGDSISEVCTIVFILLFKSWIISMSELNIFFFPLLVSAHVCEMKQVCLDFTALLLTGMELLIFPQNIQLGLDLDVCECSLH